MVLIDVHVLTQPPVTLRAAGGIEVTMIPFTGTVTGLLNGIVEPGGTDTQTVDETGARRMSARYMLSGTLSPDIAEGRNAKLYVENNGCFPDGKVSFPFRTVPTFITDDPDLAACLRRHVWRGEGVLEEDGLHIRFHGESA